MEADECRAAVTGDSIIGDAKKTDAMLNSTVQNLFFRRFASFPKRKINCRTFFFVGEIDFGKRYDSALQESAGY